jgi:hypothetical protein
MRRDALPERHTRFELRCAAEQAVREHRPGAIELLEPSLDLFQTSPCDVLPRVVDVSVRIEDPHDVGDRHAGLLEEVDDRKLLDGTVVVSALATCSTRGSQEALALVVPERGSGQARPSGELGDRQHLT